MESGFIWKGFKIQNINSCCSTTLYKGNFVNNKLVNHRSINIQIRSIFWEINFSARVMWHLPFLAQLVLTCYISMPLLLIWQISVPFLSILSTFMHFHPFWNLPHLKRELYIWWIKFYNFCVWRLGGFVILINERLRDSFSALRLREFQCNLQIVGKSWQGS